MPLIKKIDAHTRKFGIIGYPLGHTFSPAMHNAAFAARGVNAVYLAFPMRNLLNLKHSLRQLGIDGLSITIPYKVRMSKLVDKIDPLALQIGSINTLIRNKADIFEGYNTDGRGAVKAIEQSGFKIQGKKILLIGSGGSARAIAFALLEKKPAQIGFLARNRRAVSGLVRNLRLIKKPPAFELLFYPEAQSARQRKRAAKVRTRRVIRRVERSVLVDPEQVKGYDLIIQTTPMGMKGHASQRSLPLTKEFLFKHQAIFDIVYNPQMTPFLKLGKNKKLDLITGEKMLLYQGALQFELFTGVDAPIKVMEEALKRELKRK